MLLGTNLDLQDVSSTVVLEACQTASKFAGLKTFEEDYSETPDYPVIDPETRGLSEVSKKYLKDRLDWVDSIKNSPTVEEKLIQLNMRRKYGWKTNVINEDMFGYDCTPYYKFITRTYLVPENGLPAIYSDTFLTEKARHFAEQLREPLKDILRLEFEGTQHTVDENNELKPSELSYAKTQAVANQINRLLIAGLASDTAHLRTCQVDHKPKLEAFWFCGGMEPKNREIGFKKVKKKFYGEKSKIDPEGPVERNFQYLGSSLLQIRCVNPIKNYVDAESDLCEKGDNFPDRMRQFAKAYGIPRTVRYGTCLNGHWSGDGHRSSLLSIHPQHHLAHDYRQNSHWLEDQQSALDSQAIVCSFSRLLAQAYNFGFDQFTDLDYPFSTQFISTNGLNWSFYTYQLNTIKISKHDYQKNNRQNLCWGTKPMKIIEENHQLNEVVLENLIKFYLNPPVPISSSKGNVTPFIQATLNDFPDLEREFVFENLRDMYCMRNIQPEKKPLPEIYDWEKIFKIRHKTMPMAARKRFFEFPFGFPGSNPYEEPFVLRNPRKVPKALFRYRRLLKLKKEDDEINTARDKERQTMFGEGENNSTNK
ncbi:unnamed protein product [Allacma fusca]|uniref:Uncharacterized protein n=1 Tax=Allacma fusca TaxID=39272 RepID=A0A8J2Q2H9_9HEXA|nr:unnamed protein product [Allacma fusca]